MGESNWDPAVYYGKLPKKFKGKVDLVRALSSSLIGNEVLHLDHIPEGRTANETYLARILGPKLEAQILENLKCSDGDLVLLEEPQARITGYGPIISGPKGSEVCAEYRLSANGELYRARGVKTSFSKE